MKQDKKQPRIFYGWYIIAVGMLGALMTAGSSQLFMSIMLKPLTAEFGWSRTAATGAITTGTIMAGLLSYPFGKLADRYGPRWLTAAGAFVTACTYAAIACFVNLWQFYAVYVIGRIVATNTVSGVVPKTAAVNWFRRYRGRVMGLLTMTSPLGASLLAIVAQLIMMHHGWRAVFIVFAFAMLFLQAFPAALVLRRQPEDMGLVPDGGPRAGGTSAPSIQTPAQEEFSWTLSEAVRTPTLWLLILANIVAPGVGAGIGFHLVAYYTDVGIAATVAVGALSLYALIGALGSVIWGFLSERLSERFLATMIMALTAIAILYLQTVRANAGAFIFAILFGLTCRGEGTLFNIITAQYYGRGSYGAISGFILPFHRLGLGLGPLISSVSFDMNGSYHAVFNVFMAISAITAVLMLMAKKPNLPVRKSMPGK